jgi:hypothetical protein
MNPTIVVAAYQRETSIQRLLHSLNVAIYPDNNVHIILSLDGGYSQAVLRACEKFKQKFQFGYVEINAREKNLGLKKHILWCGQQSSLSGSVIVLEDDLYVDPQFYLYAQQAAIYFEQDETVAGISLYSQHYNEYALLPFYPLESNHSNYLMQVACSWGQLWTEKQWNSFYYWYSKNEELDVNLILNLPDVVKSWSNKSWKKYYSAYLAVHNKYFAYPYRSYTTNCSDPGGQHLIDGTSLFQVPLAQNKRSLDAFNFTKLKESAITYDPFMEPKHEFFFADIGYDSSQIEIDLYATKPLKLLQEKEYSLTSKKVQSAIETYSLSFKPIENLYLSPKLKNAPVSLAESALVLKESKYNYHQLLVFLSDVDTVNKKYPISFFIAFWKKVTFLVKKSLRN